MQGEENGCLACFATPIASEISTEGESNADAMTEGCQVLNTCFFQGQQKDCGLALGIWGL